MGKEEDDCDDEEDAAAAVTAVAGTVVVRSRWGLWDDTIEECVVGMREVLFNR